MTEGFALCSSAYDTKKTGAIQTTTGNAASAGGDNLQSGSGDQSGDFSVI